MNKQSRFPITSTFIPPQAPSPDDPFGGTIFPFPIPPEDVDWSQLDVYW